MNKWICSRIFEFVLVDSARICWYNLPMKESPEADLAPAHAGVPALRGGGVDAVDEEEGCLP